MERKARLGDRSVASSRSLAMKGAHDPSAPTRILVRIRLHLFLSRRHARRKGSGGGRRGAPVAAVPAGSRLQGARVGELALRDLPGQGTLYVARHGAGGCPPRAALLPAENLPAERASGG